MAELIAVLMVTVGQLLASGAVVDSMAGQVQVALEEGSPFTVAEIAVDFTVEEPAPPVETDPAPGGDSYRIDFEFTDIEIEPLLIHELEIAVGGIQPAAGDGLTIGWITFEAQIDDQALQEALTSHAPSILNPRITISHSGISLGGRLRTWLAAVPFEVQGSLSVVNQTQLVFDIDRSRMVGIGIPAAVNNVIEHEVNPVYDLADFATRSKDDIARAKSQLDYEFYLSVNKLTPRDGHIIVVGKA